MKQNFVNVISAALVLSNAILSGCTNKSQPKDNNQPTKVKIEIVNKSNEVDILNYVGTIEENSSTALGFSSLGMIEKIYVSEGDYVTRGQLLAKLNSSSAQNVLDAAEASLKQAQDGYNRLKSIYDKGSLTEVQMVDIETKLHQAQSSYNIAKKNLEDCSLYAPVSGVVGRKLAEAGEYSIIGNAILTILDISSVKVKFSLPENEISKIHSDCKSVILVAALGDKKFEGKKIEKNVSANVVSHTYPAHIVLSNPDKQMLPGMVCTVELVPGNNPDGIVIPIEIIQTTPDGKKFVWSDNSGIARRTFITTGIVRGNGVEVNSGLTPGDRIVTEGYQKISEEEKITGQ
jgi:membrane fusion protein, multidrug efflux system